MMLIALVETLTASGCGSLPPAPTGEMYATDGKIALCSELQGGVKCAQQSFATLLANTKGHRVLVFTPVVWKNVQNYIDALIRQLKGDADSTDVGFTARTSTPVNSQNVIMALQQIRDGMSTVQNNLSVGN